MIPMRSRRIFSSSGRQTGFRQISRWWPNFLVRSDHVENAADILNRDELLSRAAAEACGLIKKDSGSQIRLAQLAPMHRGMVRLNSVLERLLNLATKDFVPSIRLSAKNTRRHHRICFSVPPC